MTYPYHGFLRFAPDVLWTIDEDGQGNVVIDRNGVSLQAMVTATESLKGLIERTAVSLDVPEGVTELGQYAFMYATSMQYINIPEGVTTIATSALRNTGLLSLDLPSTITTIGSSSLSNNSSLTTLICRAVTPPSINANALTSTNLTAIYVPDASVDAYKAASNWSTYASIILPLSDLPE